MPAHPLAAVEQAQLGREEGEAVEGFPKQWQQVGQLIIVGGLVLAALVVRTPPADAGPAPFCASVPRLGGVPVTALAPVALESGGGLLVGTADGLWLVRLDERAALADVARVPLPFGLAWVTALATDEDGSAWIATDRGVLYHPAGCPGADGCPFRTWPAEDLPFRTVLAVTPDGLVGGPRGVAAWDGRRWRADPRAPSGVTAMEAVEGHVWATTRGGSLWRRSESGVWQPVPLPDQRPGSPLWALDEESGRLAVVGQAGMWVVNLDDEGAPTNVRRVSSQPLAAVKLRPQGWGAVAGPAVPSSREETCRRTVQGNAAIGLEIISPPGGEPVTALAAFAGGTWVGTPRGLFTDALHLRWKAPPPRNPVVLVPGLYGAPDLQGSQLKFLARALRTDGYPVFYAGSLRPDRPLADNARQLRAEVDRVRALTGAGSVWIVGHSYGGLAAEAMVRQYGAEGVAGIATLGTPHAGMWLWADLIAEEIFRGGADAGLADLLPQARTASVGTAPHVPRLRVAGDALPDDYAPLLAGLPPNDGLIAVAEALAGSGQQRRMALVHGWNLRLLELGVPALTGPENAVYLDVLRPWLEGEALPPGWRLPPPQVPAPSTPPHWEDLGVYDLAPSEAVTVSITFPTDGVRHILVAWDGPRPRTRLVAPDGERLSEDRLVARDDVAVVPFEAVGLRPVVLWSVQGRAGEQWQLEVGNPGQRTTTARVRAVDPNSPGLEVRVKPRWGAPGQAVQVIVNPVDADRVRLFWQDERIELERRPDGTFVGTLRLPAQPGFYAFKVQAGSLVRFAAVGVGSP